ncbi:MAG TPA: ABC transporter ATP-binding protein [Gemmatimonadaceae bacterium]|nr:ABC transporter ATP-binding protein [Gemmatimonadaceae bacterium]
MSTAAAASSTPAGHQLSTVADAGERGAASDAVLQVRGLTKRFPVARDLPALLRDPLRRARATALDGVSLTARRGECVGVLGPNGAGKSTLFRVLLTLVLPDAGSATLCGLDVTEDAEAVRRLVAGVSPDERSLYWRLSAYENLRLYATFRGLRGTGREAAIRDALGVVGLDDVGAQLVGRYSSGMRQRLLIARALLARPALLLLDEPTRSLDPLAARAFRTFVRDDLVQRQGCTVLLATHTAEEAFETCDRVVVLDRGRVVAEGAAARLAAAHGGDAYELWVPVGTEELVADAVLATAGGRRLGVRPAAEPGWLAVRVALAGGAAAAASLVDRLVRDGVAVGRAEPVRPSLAELLERVTGRERPGAGAAEREAGDA